MVQRLLLVEDDQSLIDGLQYALEKEGYQLTVAQTAAAARERLEREVFDLLLLDITLPDGSGVALCEWLRSQGSVVPVIFLTALDEEVHVIRALDSGGDDYITKPFRLGELCSRIRAQLRRGAALAHRETVLAGGGLRIEGGRALLDGEPLALTATELRLLTLFLENKGRVLTRTILLEQLWDDQGSFVDDNTLSVYIRRLREKIERDPSVPVHLCTVRGLGYEWREEE